MTKRVQVQPCRNDGSGGVERCTVKQAEFFGVYMGEPGSFKWCADFDFQTDALNWAQEVAETFEVPLEDLCES